MRITTLIANHNYGEYLKGSIESALAQTYPYQCVCVIDDASTDASKEIAKLILFGEEQPRIFEKNGIILSCLIKDGRKLTLIELPQCVGPSEARNVGIRANLEETEIFAVLDADDEMKRDKLAELVKHFQNPEIGIVYANYDILNVQTGQIRTEFKEPFNIFRLQQECIIHSGSLIRKEALLSTEDEFGFYDRNMRTCEDYDLWIRICRRYVAYHVPKSLTLVRWQPKNSTDTVSKDIWNQNWARIRWKMENYKK
jgi:glycosyltransferase involved in cell wall biosynthesis